MYMSVNIANKIMHKRALNIIVDSLILRGGVHILCKIIPACYIIYNIH